MYLRRGNIEWAIEANGILIANGRCLLCSEHKYLQGAAQLLRQFIRKRLTLPAVFYKSVKEPTDIFCHNCGMFVQLEVRQ